MLPRLDKWDIGKKEKKKLEKQTKTKNFLECGTGHHCIHC